MRVAVLSFISLSVGCAGTLPESKESAEERATLKQALAEQGRQLAALDQKVTAISEKVSKLPAEPIKPAKPSWSCAARCVNSFHCTTNGDQSVKWKDLNVQAGSAAEAFKALIDKCSDAPMLSGQCKGGNFVHEDATIVNACVRE